jgi:hypothetical protein
VDGWFWRDGQEEVGRFQMESEPFGVEQGSEDEQSGYSTLQQD